MTARIQALVGRLIELIGWVASAARWSAAVITLAGVVISGVLRLEPETGFGWSFTGWWLPALVLFVPAVIVLAFSISAAKLAELARSWPDRLGDVADAGLESAEEVVGSVRSVVGHRRGFMGLAKGLSAMRRIALSAREFSGDAAPALASFSPAFLLLTLLAVLTGALLVVVAAGLVLLRIVL
jgi:hypothetical protein